MDTDNKLETATFANGCFWCTEAVFKRLKGIESVMSGYTGGRRENPSYSQVHSGATGHAEAIQLTYDPQIVSYETLLDVFFATHNPTTLNQDGANIGEEYRSEIFYHSEAQKTAAEKKIKELEKEKRYQDPIVTKITPYEAFYKAEDYHQNYYDNNRNYPYCTVIIDPKVKKLLAKFGDEVKDEYKQDI